MKYLNLPILIWCFCLPLFAQQNRSFDGTGNNISHPDWGSAGARFANVISNGFTDSISLPAGLNRPNPREISNTLGSQFSFAPNELGLSDFIWGWGQFIDHDINLNLDNHTENHNIAIPKCEPLFDPLCTDTMEMRMFRSRSDLSTGTSINNPRRHINEITGFIDGSAVYGSDSARAGWLRTYTDGKLKTSSGDLLPWNTTDGEYNSPVDTTAPFMLIDGPPLTRFFVGGDIRVNEQPGLISFHTLWVREHNRLCDQLKSSHPSWTDHQLYERARKMVGALIQAITYEEFLPNMGVILDPYPGYDHSRDPGIMNVFSAAAYRFGHTMINGRLLRYEENGNVSTFGLVDLRNAFFNPTMIKNEGGIEPFFRGMAAQEHQFVDPMIMDDIRNFLFGPPGSGGIDLLSINLARGRERGLPDYNTIRSDLSLSPHASFSSLTSDPDLRNKLSSIYNNDLNDIDPWIGLMSEDHLSNAIIGEGLEAILKMQFAALRDCDRYYYENDPAFTSAEINDIKSTRLSDVILRNTSIIQIQENVFEAVPRDELSIALVPFQEIRNMKLSAYPNPVQKYFNIVIESNRQSAARLSIWDANGKIISEEQVNLNKGMNELNFELSEDLANGFYTIILRSDSGNGQLKIVKQK